jgi:hypothetical protein
MRDDRADKDQRRHPQRNDLSGVMDLFQNEIITGLDAATIAEINPADAEAGNGKPNHPAMASRLAVAHSRERGRRRMRSPQERQR